ncbi:Protoheme IX farnesyltransferase 1 [Polaribacter huanghezhanensis]|uniref:heme o synthase n=1 Tax=Polaribacter huanghezhanensis TaxID=1354726 RepID=UPI0026499CD8|nr:heme o synthase [Polaribacter huanghezhanensis]WKD85653.1 Protoheme IX farnesyltransferase 1 [Polaribacter huanghezhanensis]
MNSISRIENKSTIKNFVTDFLQLTKVGLSLSVVFSSIAGYLLAAEIVDVFIIFQLAIGGYFMVGASNAFNQVIERDTDSLMKRTMNRPLPTGRMTVSTALTIAFLFTILGIAILYNINAKSALFGAISIFLYTSLYTPLKSVTPLTVFVGAIPGAIPFMLGWVAATNQFGIEAGFLFLIQFFWQFPHFWAIGWLQFEEYQKAGFNMLPMNKKDKGAIKQIIFYTFIMILVSVAPVLKVTGAFYIYPATAVIIALAGCSMLYYGIQLYKTESNIEARKLMLSSVIYITLVQIIYVIDKFLH